MHDSFSSCVLEWAMSWTHGVQRQLVVLATTLNIDSVDAFILCSSAPFRRLHSTTYDNHGNLYI